MLIIEMLCMICMFVSFSQLLPVDGIRIFGEYYTLIVRVGYCRLFVGTFCIIVCLFLVASSSQWSISAYIFGEYNLCTFWLLLCVNWNVLYHLCVHFL